MTARDNPTEWNWWITLWVTLSVFLLGTCYPVSPHPVYSVCDEITNKEDDFSDGHGRHSSPETKQAAQVREQIKQLRLWVLCRLNHHHVTEVHVQSEMQELKS